MKDDRYMTRTTGQDLIPVGMNLCWTWDPGNFEYGSNAYKTWMNEMQSNEMNYARLWINATWGLSLMGKDGPTGVMYSMHNNQKDAWQLDKIFQIADKNNIDLMLSIFNFGTFKDGDWRDNNGWNSAHGGPLDYPFDIFLTQNSQNVKNHLRYIVSRWGYSTRISSYEMWNEVDVFMTDPVFCQPGSVWANDMVQRQIRINDWHDEMFTYVRSIDPHQHLVTTSTTFFDSEYDYGYIFGNTDPDFVQSHQYFTLTDQVDMQAAAAQHAANMIQWYDLPHIHGEGNAGDPGPLNSWDPHGLEVHAANWSSLLSGSFGIMQSWWWNEYIDMEHRDLYSLYKGVGKFGGVMERNINREFLPGFNESALNGLRWYFLADSRQSKDVYGWVQCSNHTRDNLVQNGNNSYVLTQDVASKPAVPAAPIVVIPVRERNKEYIVDWYDPGTGVYVSSTSVTSTAMDGTFIALWTLPGFPPVYPPLFKLPYGTGDYNGYLLLSVPASILAASPMGDAAFHCHLDCNVENWQVGDLVEYAYPETSHPLATNPAGDKVFYVNNNDIINCLYWDSGTSTWEWSNMDNVAAGVNTNIVVDNNGDLYFGNWNNKMIRCYFASGTWHTQYLGGIAGDVVGPIVYSSGAHQVYYRSTGSTLKGIYWDWGTSQWMGTDLNSVSGNQVSTGLAVGPSGQIFYRTTGGHMHSLYYTGSNWAWTELNGLGNDVFGQLVTDDVGKVFYVKDDGSINCLYFQNSNWNWSELDGAESSGAYGHLVKAGDKIFYDDFDEHINCLYYDGTWHMSPLNDATVDYPASHVAMSSDASGQVFYVDSNGEIRRLAYRNQCDSPSEWALKSFTEEEEEVPLASGTTDLRLYPNPTSTTTTIDGLGKNISSVSLFATDGRAILTEVASGPSLVLDAAAFTHGCYIVRVLFDDGTVGTKLMMVD